MKKKVFSFILSFTVIAVVATAINCGCAFAEMPQVHQTAEQSAVGHCEQHEAESQKESEECCVGCNLQLGALNPHNIDFQFLRSNELLLPHSFLTRKFLQIVSKHPFISAPFGGHDTQGVSISSSQQPIYIVLESFLI